MSLSPQTDTEVLAHLLDHYYDGNPLEAIAKVMVRIRGSYALGILFQDCPGTIYAVRKEQPDDHRQQRGEELYRL